ncbi:MAG TPA: MBL fold metallo-hydrolase [Acidimicrobiia bacterium]
MRIGELEVLPVIDGSARLPATLVYSTEGAVGKGGDIADWKPHSALLEAEAHIELMFGGFLVRTGERVMLVDAGIGATATESGLQGGKLLESLAGHGLTADDVTDVVFTHLHFDHIGWASQAGEVVFPNATYRCDRRDWEHFVGHDDNATRTLAPVTSQFEPWDGDITLAPGVDTRLAAGHTPGSALVVLSSGSERALLLGDVVHCPVELLDDEWAGVADVDPEMALRTRVALARELEGTDVPVAAAHFPGLAFGRLLRGEGKRQWTVG